MIAVVDSGVANLASVTAALERLGVSAEVTSDAERIRQAERVILPGVGAAAAGAKQLKNKGLDSILRALTQPVLGICLGMQLLFERSYEGDGQPVECLGILPGEVRAMKASPNMPVPHMGWNQISPVKAGHPLLQGIGADDYVYFVHSFTASVGDTTVASCDYGQKFAAIVASRNFYGCQFHPERSGAVGSRILENFIRI